jgi:hypothetical protein
LEALEKQSVEFTGRVISALSHFPGGADVDITEGGAGTGMTIDCLHKCAVEGAEILD